VSSLKTRILVDTTYLLPVLGVEVKGVRRALERISELYERNRVELYYSPFSILEALGKISKTRYDPLRVEKGLIAITESGVFNPALPSVEACLRALELRARGFRDLIDLLLYSTARELGIKFLTRDVELIDFLHEQGESLECIMAEDELESLA